jgi:hypothetical protein
MHIFVITAGTAFCVESSLLRHKLLNLLQLVDQVVATRCTRLLLQLLVEEVVVGVVRHSGHLLFLRALVWLIIRSHIYSTIILCSNIQLYFQV